MTVIVFPGDPLTRARDFLPISEFIRELFEMGIPVTYGSDSHHEYGEKQEIMEEYLRKVGFKPGDFSELKEEDLW